MDKTTGEKIRLGIFVILGTAMLLVAAYLIGDGQDMFGRQLTVTSVFKDVGGLQIGNNVRYSGINVGTVRSLEMEQDTAIRVIMNIEKRMFSHIKKNAVATIGSDGLVGSMIVNIIPGEGPADLIDPGDEIASLSRITTLDMMSTLNVTNENAARLTADLLKVTRALNSNQGSLGRLLNDTAMGADLSNTVKSLSSAGLKVNALLSRMNEIVAPENMSGTVAGKILTDTVSGQGVDSLLQNLKRSGAQLEQTLVVLDSLILEIAGGKGALRYLSRDTLFVKRLSTSMKNIEEGTERFNQNMEALKHNFLTRRYFKKLEKEQGREKETRDP
jgi:phospholipid/cholesterol/gamma-HCH transport system substrate-binding protein